MWPFRKKNKKQLTYQFLCKKCDIFFYRDLPGKNRCPNCNCPGELYEVYEAQSKE